MSVAFCGLMLAHPVVNVPGSFDASAAARAFGADAVRANVPFAAYLSRPVTLAARPAAPPPSLWESAAGLIRASARTTTAVATYLADVLPHDARLGVPLLVTLAGTGQELAALAAALDARPEPAALQLALDAPAATGASAASAPAAHATTPPDAAATAAAIAAVRAATSKPLLVRLDATAPHLLARAQAAETAGADALALALAPLAAAYHLGRPWFAAEPARLSGPAVRPLALAAVAALAGRVALPLVAEGGVQRGRHAADLLDAGASLVAVGTESFRDPRAASRIADELGTDLG